MTNETDPEFTKLLGDHLLNAKGFYDYGISKGLTTREQLQLTVEARIDWEKQLREGGLSLREIAKITGVSKTQVANDLEGVQGMDKTVQKVDSATQARIKNEEKRKRLLSEPADIKLEPGFYLGDFRDLAHKIADDSIEFILTDPPYDKGSIPLYRDAAAVAARILKPGGSFIAYAGHRHLPAVLEACNQYLDYWWTIAGLHAGPTQIMQRLGIRVEWKPLIWFVKGTRGDVQNILYDVLDGGGREKDQHEWQQSEAEAAFLIEKLAPPLATVIDFFAGSGTTLVAAKKLGRKFIGFEKDENAAAKIVQRLELAT